LAAPTASSSAAAAGSSAAGWALVVGALSVATLPVAVAATRWSGSYDLLHAAFAIPVALGLGVAAVALARRARRLAAIALGGGASPGRARAGWWLGVAGISLASSATISIVVYGVLTYLADR
jgi:hypothetical protein